MHVTRSFSDANENFSFSNFTKSSANRSILSWKNFVVELVIMIRSKPCKNKKSFLFSCRIDILSRTETHMNNT